ncbi:turripeptide Gsp9.3-like [Eupeodes corollae]|uniref:turripeptide Gsp9.3-like n=1 Tax=Eupeodes corollae TaxID=290404 RepID=UPI0024913A40|nr:turripeptide Gsp9.3-like [Eupeodes corollae]
MKTAYVGIIVALLVVLAISIDVKADGETDCPTFCTFDYRPVCGYNGRCYRKFGNACTLKVERCSNKDNKMNVKAVDMGLCEEALTKSNPKVIACDQEQ